jgi:uncharacterized protein (TIGR03067 family)
MKELLIILSIVISSGSDDKDDDTKKELKKLQGVWRIVLIESEGFKMDKLGKDAKLTVMDGKLVFVVGDIPLNADYKLNPSKNPKTIDMVLMDPCNKGKVILGIYDLQGEDLKICFSLPGKERPTDFTAKENSKRKLYILKRIPTDR